MYSFNPHRIVAIDNSSSLAHKPRIIEHLHWERVDLVSLPAHTVAESVILMNSSEIWKYGDIRGGSSPILVDTPYGKRYLSAFHSSYKFMMPWLRTFFMGIYLFNTHPPFEITHLSTEPIIPESYYTSKYGPWTQPSMDYVIFPMTAYSVNNSVLYVLVGRNDANGWIVKLNQTALLQSLRPVQTKVTFDFTTHKDTAYSQQHRIHN